MNGEPPAAAKIALTVGVISDTHGLLRPAALRALAGSDHIVHAGDIGDPGILDALAALAPLTVVRGNNDRDVWARRLPDTAVLPVGGHHLYVLHDLGQLDLDPAAAGISTIIAGHSHKPTIERRNGVLYFNPGSAGPRRFRLPIAIGRLRIDPAVAGDNGVEAEIIDLEP